MLCVDLLTTWLLSARYCTYTSSYLPESLSTPPKQDKHQYTPFIIIIINGKYDVDVCVTQVCCSASLDAEIAIQATNHEYKLYECTA